MITNKNNVKHYTWGNNCNSWVLADTAGLSVKQEGMPPNTKEQLHFHKNAQQFFYILKGVATFYCDDEVDTIGPNTGILIPAGTKHFIANEAQHDLEFLVIAQPSTNEDRLNV
jgi:mannose-6-phosphate isomerase-like protein (cupin superfamily)